MSAATKADRQGTDGRHYMPVLAGGWEIEPTTQTILVQFDEPSRWGDVWTLPVSGGTPIQATHIYDPLDRDFEMPRQEKFEWKGADGQSVEGLLIFSLGYKPGTKYSLVVEMNGGPVESDPFGGGPGQM